MQIHINVRNVHNSTVGEEKEERKEKSMQIVEVPNAFIKNEQKCTKI